VAPPGGKCALHFVRICQFPDAERQGAYVNCNLEDPDVAAFDLYLAYTSSLALPNKDCIASNLSLVILFQSGWLWFSVLVQRYIVRWPPEHFPGVAVFFELANQSV
jgi:hypothetical protein